MAARRALALALLLGWLPGIAPMLTARAEATTTILVDQRYAIAATLDVASGRLDAVEELTVTNRSSRRIDHVNLSVIPRALGYLRLEGPLTVDGTEVSSSWTTTTNLRVPLPGRLASGEAAVIRVHFGLDVGRSTGAFAARLSRDNGVISFGQWFPILSREHDTHGIGDSQVSYSAERIRLDLTTTAALPRDAVACPGLVTAPETSGTRWACEVTDVRDFSFVVNPRFRLTTRTVGDVALRVYTETVLGEVTAAKAAAALTGLGEAFGPYPWPDLVLAEVGTGGGFSMEYPRAIHLTRDKVTDDYVINHEVAHQWFYAQLGNDQMLEPWLDEAFADFGARYMMGVGENHCSTRAVDSSVFAWPAGPVSGGDWTSCDGYFHTVFYRGTAFLNALRAAMGEDAFFEALRAFIDDNRFGTITARRLLGHLQRSTPADLLPIYQRFLTGYDHPPAAPSHRDHVAERRLGYLR